MEESVRSTFNMACPNCGDDTQLAVVITTLANLSSDGTDPIGDHDWDTSSPCLCKGCEFAGRVGQFQLREAVR